MRREVININFPTAKVLTDHLDKNVNKYLLDLGKNKFSENEISHIVKCIGGSMTDIRLIITEYLRGQSPQGFFKLEISLTKFQTLLKILWTEWLPIVWKK